MTRRRTALAVSCTALLALPAAACGATRESPTLRQAASPTSGNPGVPAEFRHACGHPHAVVHVKRLPVTVSGAHCDLVGVTVVFAGVGAHIQPRGEGTGVFADGVKVSHELQVMTAKNGDVSVTGD